MTGFLASVTSAAEAETAMAGGADIIDLKDPRAGALGALPPSVIRQAAQAIAGRRTVSATAGDLPMQPQVVADAAARIAEIGVDIVKVGFFSGGDAAACIAELARLAAGGTRIVAVLFADTAPDFALIDLLRDAGFAGAMLDTADKGAGGLRRHLDDRALGEFVDRVRCCGMISGLAGSLAIADIAPLHRLSPDYLGFRGALCRAGRTSELDVESVRAARAAIDRAADYQEPAARIATAAAGAHRAAHSRAAGSPSTSSEKST
ncbi:MAG: (5-formylfuran-3-yl)methyl phosphate synthase [Dongiaceae bacterium]